MNIEIRNPTLEARIQKQLDTTGSDNLEQVLVRLLETQEEQDRWLAECGDEINTQIQVGLDQLDRGEGLTEEALQGHLARLKMKAE